MRKIFLRLITILCIVSVLLPTAVGFAAQSYTGIINADSVAFRKGPSSDSSRIRRLSKGTVVEVLETNVNAEWHKVRYNEKTGYINRRYVTLMPASGDTVYQGTVVNVKNNVNVRASASKDGKLLGTADLHAVFTVKRANVDGWHEIDYNGKTGYISAEYLQVAPKASRSQLSSLSISGGTLSPAFSPDTYGYVVQANSDKVKITAAGNSGVKVKVGDSGKNSVTVSMPKTGTKTVRISVGGKVRYTLYIVRNVITVGTWNIKRGNGNLPEMGRLIEMQQPDLMGIQEVFCSPATSYADKVDNLLSLRTKDMAETQFAAALNRSGGSKYGVGILSAYDIRSSEVTKLYSGGKEQRILQKIVVKINGHRVSVYNTHLSYESSSLRARQFAEIKKIMDADRNEYKILFGDFNAKASEFSVFGSDYNVLNTGSTKFYDYSGAVIRKNEIDNIIVSSNITALNTRMIDVDLSDHNPIFAYLKLN